MSWTRQTKHLLARSPRLSSYTSNFLVWLEIAGRRFSKKSRRLLKIFITREYNSIHIIQLEVIDSDQLKKKKNWKRKKKKLKIKKIIIHISHERLDCFPFTLCVCAPLPLSTAFL